MMMPRAEYANLPLIVEKVGILKQVTGWKLEAYGEKDGGMILSYFWTQTTY